MDNSLQIRSIVRPPFPLQITVRDVIELLDLLDLKPPRKSFKPLNSFKVYRVSTIHHMQNNNNVLPLSSYYFRTITSINWSLETPTVKKAYQMLASDIQTLRHELNI